MTEYLHSRLIGKRLVGFDVVHGDDADASRDSQGSTKLKSKVGDKPMVTSKIAGKPSVTSKIGTKPAAPAGTGRGAAPISPVDERRR